VKASRMIERRTSMHFNSTHHCLSSSNWGRLLAPVGYHDDLMKSTKWRSSRPYDHMSNAWRFHEDWRTWSRT